MSTMVVFGIAGAGLVGLGLFAAIVQPQPMCKLLGFNLLGGGVFLLFGVIARRGADAGFAGDPVPQAIIITGVVVAFSATALAVTLMQRLFEESGETALDPPPDGESGEP